MLSASSRPGAPGGATYRVGFYDYDYGIDGGVEAVAKERDLELIWSESDSIRVGL